MGPFGIPFLMGSNLGILNLYYTILAQILLSEPTMMGLEPVPPKLEHIATNRSRTLDRWNGGCDFDL